jgi:hypothetical protein
MLGSVKLGLAAAALGVFAIAPVVTPAFAFTFENIGGDASGGSRYSGQDSSTNTLGSGGTRLFGPGGPTVQFGAQQGAPSPFIRTPGAGFAPLQSQTPPDPYNLANPNRY